MGRHNTVAGRMAESAGFRAKLFTKLARLITVAARNGSDPSTNSALRSAIIKAKDNSMPKDNIDRAIKKGAGDTKDAAQFEEILYEGFGPGGVGILIDTLTDSRNRTYPELRVLFQKNGGALGEMGSISWMFQKKGVFLISLKKYPEEHILDISLDAGIEDIEHFENEVILTCNPIKFATIRDALTAKNMTFERSGIEYIPDNYIELSLENSEKLNILINKLHEHDDVQNIYINSLFPSKTSVQ